MRELHAHLAPGLVQVAALHVRIGPGEVDELEDAQGGRRLGEADRARRDAGLEDDHLAGLDVADVFGADDVERGRLGREAPAGRGVVAGATGRRRGRPSARRQPPEDERPEAERIADADDPPLVEDDEAVGAADPRQDLAQRLDGVGGRLVGEERGQELGVGGCRQAGAAALEQLEQVAGVDEVAVVADRERPARPEAVGRLGVLPDGRAGRRVAAVGDRELAAQARQAALVEDRADHAEVLVEHQLLAVADRQPGRLLAAVLEREQAERRDRRGIGRLGARQDDPEHAAHRSALPAEGAAEAVLPGVAEVAERDLERVGDPAPPRSSTRARRDAGGELDDEPVATDRADRLDRQAVLAREQLERRGVARPAGDDEARRALAEQVDRRVSG